VEIFKNFSKTNGFIGDKMKNNEKGIALITTLVLGVVALAFIAALFYMLTSGTKMSGTSKRYYTALEAAKGASEFIMNKIVSSENLTCNNGNPCTPCPTSENNNCKIDLNLNFGNYNVDAYLLNQESLPTYSVYTIRVRAYSSNKPNEKAVIEFVYKVE
jgi:type II secretory pathway component PulK